MKGEFIGEVVDFLRFIFSRGYILGRREFFRYFGYVFFFLSLFFGGYLCIVCFFRLLLFVF